MLLKLYLYAKDGCTISQSRYLSDKLKKKPIHHTVWYMPSPMPVNVR